MDSRPHIMKNPFLCYLLYTGTICMHVCMVNEHVYHCKAVFIIKEQVGVSRVLVLYPQ